MICLHLSLVLKKRKKNPTLVKSKNKPTTYDNNTGLRSVSAINSFRDQVKASMKMKHLNSSK